MKNNILNNEQLDNRKTLEAKIALAITKGDKNKAAMLTERLKIGDKMNGYKPVETKGFTLVQK